MEFASKKCSWNLLVDKDNTLGEANRIKGSIFKFYPGAVQFLMQCRNELKADICIATTAGDEATASQMEELGVAYDGWLSGIYGHSSIGRSRPEYFFDHNGQCRKNGEFRASGSEKNM